MKIATWNVNGLRACLKKGFAESFQEIGADIVCLQETKMSRGQAEVEFDGYAQYWNSAKKPGYSGTLILSKIEPICVTYGIGIEEHDQEGRVVTAEFEKFQLVNCYTPNSQRGLARLDYRMEWEIAFREYLLKLSEKKPVILCGDLNVAHKEIDLTHPKPNVKNAGFTPEEREKMTLLLGSGFVDAFRHLYPDRKQAYTWWSYMGNAREKNVGWRIDYFIVSEGFAGGIKDCVIRPEIMGSDHCPVELFIET